MSLWVAANAAPRWISPPVSSIWRTLFCQAPGKSFFMDNLNTHNKASLYEAFPPEKARALCERFEIHYTPKHGS